MKKAVAALAVVAALGGAAGSAQAITHAQFVARGNAICRATAHENRVAAARDALAAFVKLGPPAGQQGTFRAMLYTLQNIQQDLLNLLANSDSTGALARWGGAAHVQGQRFQWLSHDLGLSCRAF
jgi:hypothetical protein